MEKLYKMKEIQITIRRFLCLIFYLFLFLIEFEVFFLDLQEFHLKK